MTTCPAATQAVPIDRRTFVRRAAGLAASTALLGLGELARAEQARSIRVRVWSEGTAPRSVYPNDIDGAIADFLAKQAGLKITRARLGQPHAGLSDAELDTTDALVWWGRLRHGDLPDDRARAIAARVREGRLGFVALHASCLSKPFVELMGGPCELGGFRDDGRPERVEVKAPGHPLARGVAAFTIPKTAMFAEPFRVPEPEAVVLVSKFDRGETFRSGMTWKVGKGRVAYFRPGHDGFPVFFHPGVRQVVANAAIWAARGV
jgi:trehalose utilization protein